MRSKKPTTNPQPSSRVMVNKDALAKLAHELYLRRGGEHGHDREDWLMAELILLEQQERPASNRRATDSFRRLEDKF